MFISKRRKVLADDTEQSVCFLTPLGDSSDRSSNFSDDSLQFHLEEKELLENTQYYSDATAIPQARPSDYSAMRWRRDTAGRRSFTTPPAVEPSVVASPAQSKVHKYCIDNLKGTCKRKESCPKLHVDCIDNLSDRLAIIDSYFCPRFGLSRRRRRLSRCNIPFCRYLHATAYERSVFVEEGHFTSSLSIRNNDKVCFSDICVDHLKFRCSAGSRCSRRHVAEVTDIHERMFLVHLIFCQYYYQQGKCYRGSNCRYLHTGREDVSYFLKIGRLPGNLQTQTSQRPFRVSASLQRRLSPPPTTAVPFHVPNVQPSFQKRCTISSRQMEQLMYNKLRQDNEQLQQNVHDLKQLLINSCHCISMAVQLVSKQ